MKNTVEYPDTI